jgi:hypothetical protein
LTILSPLVYDFDGITWTQEHAAKRCNIYAGEFLVGQFIILIGICFTGTLFMIFFIPETFPGSKL